MWAAILRGVRVDQPRGIALLSKMLISVPGIKITPRVRWGFVKSRAVPLKVSRKKERSFQVARGGARRVNPHLSFDRLHALLHEPHKAHTPILLTDDIDSK
jgi:hypothetical protein